MARVRILNLAAFLGFFLSMSSCKTANTQSSGLQADAPQVAPPPREVVLTLRDYETFLGFGRTDTVQRANQVFGDPDEVEDGRPGRNEEIRVYNYAGKIEGPVFMVIAEKNANPAIAKIKGFIYLSTAQRYLAARGVNMNDRRLSPIDLYRTDVVRMFPNGYRQRFDREILGYEFEAANKDIMKVEFGFALYENKPKCVTIIVTW